MLKRLLLISIPFLALSLFAQTDDPVEKINQLFKEAKFQDVIVQVQEYVKNYPTSQNVKSLKLYMGIAYLKTGDNDMAIQIFEEHNRDYPDFEKNEQVKYLIGKFYYDAGTYDKSKAILNEQIAAYPGGEYQAKANELLESITQLEKQAQPTAQKETVTPRAIQKKSSYSIKKITWAKITSASFLVAAPVCLVIGNSYSAKADDIYNNSYKKASTVAESQSLYSDVDKNAGNAALFKNLSWVSLVTAGGFFAVDYFSTGRVFLSATDKRISLSYKF